jgi:hypothetical protein
VRWTTTNGRVWVSEFRRMATLPEQIDYHSELFHGWCLAAFDFGALILK